MTGRCVFCAIVDGDGPATIVRIWTDAIAIVPLDPVVEGHLLVLPRLHVRDFTESPWIAGVAMQCASELAQAPCNIITSAGRAASQSVDHLHLHIVPRAFDDGLALPWHSGRLSKAQRERARLDAAIEATRLGATEPKEQTDA